MLGNPKPSRVRGIAHHFMDAAVGNVSASAVRTVENLFKMLVKVSGRQVDHASARISQTPSRLLTNVDLQQTSEDRGTDPTVDVPSQRSHKCHIPWRTVSLSYCICLCLDRRAASLHVLVCARAADVQRALPDWRCPGAMTNSKAQERENYVPLQNGQRNLFLRPDACADVRQRQTIHHCANVQRTSPQKLQESPRPRHQTHPVTLTP